MSCRRRGEARGKKEARFVDRLKTSRAIEASGEHPLIGNRMSEPIRIIINILLNVSGLQKIVSRA